MADARTEYNELERRLDEELRHQNRQRTVWAVTGIVLVVILLGYFFFMSKQVARAMEPEGIAQYGGTQLRERMPEYRKELTSSIREQAPMMTDALIDRMISETIPQGRARIEEIAMQQADKALYEAEDRLLSELDHYLAQNAPQIQAMIDSLSTSEGKEEFEEQIYAGLKKIIDEPEVQNGLLQSHETVVYATGVLEYLANPENELTDQEANTRELIAILIEVGNRADLSATDTKMPTEKLGVKKIAPAQKAE